MIEAITGKPGSGKTQLLMAGLYDDWQAGKLDRPVYIYNVPILEDKLPVHTLDDPERWYDCPDGSLIIIDEAQRIFRPRSVGSAVPDYVQHLETHRHRGMDIIWLSQHPKLVDTALRRLTERHRHVYRVFGTDRATVREWDSLADDPEPTQGEDIARKSIFKYRPEVQALYQSATIHTHQRRLPKKRIALFCFAVLAVVVGAPLGISQLTSLGESASDETTDTGAVEDTVPAPAPIDTPSPVVEPVTVCDPPVYRLVDVVAFDGLPFGLWSTPGLPGVQTADQLGYVERMDPPRLMDQGCVIGSSM